MNAPALAKASSPVPRINPPPVARYEITPAGRYARMLQERIDAKAAAIVAESQR